MSSETLAIESSGGRRDRYRESPALNNSRLARCGCGLLLHSLVHTQAACRRAFTAVGRVHQGSALCLAPTRWEPRRDSTASAVAERGDDAPEGAARERGASEERGNGTRGGARGRDGADDAVSANPTSTPRGRARPRPTGAALHRARRAQVVMPMPDANTRKAFRHFYTIQSRIYSNAQFSYAFSTLMAVPYGMVEWSRVRHVGKTRKRPVCASFAARDAQHARSRRPIGPSRTMADVEPAAADPPARRLVVRYACRPRASLFPRRPR